MKKILITGGAGFIGVNYIQFLLKNETVPFEILNLDILTYAASLEGLEALRGHQNQRHVKVDIRNRQDVRNVIQEFRPNQVVHFAAESHVDNSISGPEVFATTNVLGTFNLLEECRLLWTGIPNGLVQNRFHHVSTDEVYGTLGQTGFFDETSPYNPRSPYSASKAASDHFVKSYFSTFGMNVTLSNCSNNYGPYQHPEKYIPAMIASALKGEPLRVYGEGQNVRDWIFVEDHCRAIYTILNRAPAGEQYVVGGGNEWKNLDLAKKVSESFDPPPSIQFVKDRPGHDFRYALNSKKIETQLGWKTKFSFDEGMKQTLEWYKRKALR